MLALDNKTKRIIHVHTGLKTKEISGMAHDDIENHLERKMGKKIKLRINNGKRQGNKGLIGRGSVYLFLKRLVGLKDIDKALHKIK